MTDFRKDKTGVAQTAARAAADIVAAFSEQFSDFEEGVKAYHTLNADIFADLEKVVDGDNEMFASIGSNGGSAAKTAKSGGSRSSSRSSKTGGARKGGGGSVTLDDALGMVLNFGAFEGETLGRVLDIGADEADSEYGYGDGERDGRDYITWLAGDSQKNEFVQRRARIIADAEGIEYS